MEGKPEGKIAPPKGNERVKHFTWAWYTLPMSTGGLALLLSSQPNTFRGLMTIGTIVYVFDLIIFSMISITISIRFYRYPGTWQRSVTHTTESLFFPCFWLSLATIISGMEKFGVPHTGYWLIVVVRVLFWIYVPFTFLIAVGQYYWLFTARQLTLNSMTPSWILPIFPVMLSGTIAAVAAKSQPPYQAMAMIVAGLTFQGLGMMVSILMYSGYLGRLMQNGLPSPNLRPGMFIAVGPPSFTSLAIIGMAKSIPLNVRYFEDHSTAYEVLNIMALFTAIFLWSLSFWFFSVSVVSVLASARQMTFHLAWWALVFPNVGFTIATIQIGNELESDGIKWLGSGMSLALVMMWLFVFPHHVRAVLRKQILFEGKDEDA